MNKEEFEDWYDNGEGSENMKRRIAKEARENPVPALDEKTESQNETIEMSQIRMASIATQKNVIKMLQTKINRLETELKQYQSGNVPVNEIIADSESLALENEQQAERIKELETLILHIRDLIANDEDIEYIDEVLERK